MGLISIATTGSFKREQKFFSAQDHGHARAVADAIRWLAEEVMPEAIANDHQCHADGLRPDKGFGKGAGR